MDELDELLDDLKNAAMDIVSSGEFGSDTDAPRAEMNAAADKIRAKFAALREDYLGACELVARMHAAAVGEVRGPTIGVVEDVAALRAQNDTLREDLDRLTRGSWSRELARLSAVNAGLREEIARLKEKNHWKPLAEPPQDANGED